MTLISSICHSSCRGMLGAEVLYSPVVVSQIGATDRGASVLVRGGMFRTGDLELKSVEPVVSRARLRIHALKRRLLDLK